MNWGDMGLLALKNALRSRQKTFFCALAVCVGIASVYMICEISRKIVNSFSTAYPKNTFPFSTVA